MSDTLIIAKMSTLIVGICNIIKEHYPNSEVWIVCFYNDLDSHYAVASKSIPELNIGGASFGKGPEAWMYQGINPIWEAD